MGLVLHIEMGLGNLCFGVSLVLVNGENNDIRESEILVMLFAFR